jgi:excisionase family DNA binding protein
MTELLTSEQAAQRLGVTSQTLSVWRCVRRYPMRYVKIGRKLRYSAQDVEDFIRARTMPGIAAPTDSRRGRRPRGGHAA